MFSPRLSDSAGTTRWPCSERMATAWPLAWIDETMLRGLGKIENQRRAICEDKADRRGAAHRLVFLRREFSDSAYRTELMLAARSEARV